MNLNWYKLSKDYLDIAHPKSYLDEDSFEYQLWILKNGQMQISEVYDSAQVNTTHDQEFGHIDKETSTGRYNITTGELSISPSYKLQELGRPFPNILLKKILNSFPDAKKAYLFETGFKLPKIIPLAHNKSWYKIAQLNGKEPWQMTQEEFVNYHITGFIQSDHYDDYKTIDGIRYFNEKENFPLLYDTKQFGNTIVEFKKSGKPLQYVKTDANDNIIRDNQGKATYLSDEEMKTKGLATEDQTIVAFVGDDPIGFASNEFGATGVWVVEDYQNKGIGSYLLKEFRKTMRPSSRLGQATNSGIALTKKYHKNLVKDALQESKPVPEEVLKDYPDLIKKELSPEELLMREINK